MTILGIDPGLASVGWGAVGKGVGNREQATVGSDWSVLGYGVVRTKAGAARPKRLKKIYKELTGLIKKFQPDLLAVEEVFFGKNAKTAMMVGQAQGVAVLAAVNLGVKVIGVTPLQVKNAIVGYGRAEKEQIQIMIQQQLGMKKRPKPDDAADALAVALTAAVSNFDIV